MKKNILLNLKNKISSLENIFWTKNSKNKAFTLMEMVIVVLIIWIMLTITLNLSRSQITRMQFKLEKEDFVASFQKIQTTFLSASYSKNWVATTWVFQILSWENKVNIDYWNWFFPQNLWKSKIEKISFKNNLVNSWSFIFNWYNLGCGFIKNNDFDIITGWVAKILIARNPAHSTCLEINLNNCRIREISLWNTPYWDFCK